MNTETTEVKTISTVLNPELKIISKNNQRAVITGNKESGIVYQEIISGLELVYNNSWECTSEWEFLHGFPMYSHFSVQVTLERSIPEVNDFKDANEVLFKVDTAIDGGFNKKCNIIAWSYDKFKPGDKIYVSCNATWAETAV